MNEEHNRHMKSPRMKTKFGIFKKHFLKEGLNDWVNMKRPILNECLLSNSTAEQKARFDKF